ncbi:hypothetical protein GCM10010435_70770 [Winogradskya consettensis]|uniref:ScyD/ScyE family protein n=1 Tax=Winogradskya consettensis TaxID=113560 RepID=A0A919SNI3_9ACTN|nr:ScyD/ScyE family protein [Actinoplanes consettensis]GIM75436.1 hypothetical protein Aco04nite_45340 [Actinoplanes consettensis]
MIAGRSAVAAAAAAGALTVSLVPALPAAATTPATTTTTPALTVVATNLNNPRGLTFAPDGTLYIAEAGTGGPGPCLDGAEGLVCFGTTGSITRVRLGQQQRVRAGLPSLAGHDGSQAIGPADVAVDGFGLLSFTVGLAADPDVRVTTKKLTGMAKLYASGRSGPRLIADLGAYEKKANPDKAAADTNPAGLTVVGGTRYVVDAGANTLLKASARGKVSTVAVFGKRTVPAPAGNPDLPEGTPLPMQSVPTSVVKGPDGAFYVSELTGFPFPAGGARIYRVVPGHAPVVYATGLTNVIDLAFGPKGSLYALEIARNGLLSGDRTGALIQVDPQGEHRVVASEGLTAPGGIAIRGKDAYVTNCGVCAGAGSVVKIRL